MKTYTHVIDAVKEGKPVTEQEKEYALVLGHYLLMRLYFDGKKVISLDGTRERNKFERALDDLEDFLSRDMQPLIKGSSMEPGLTQHERTTRMTNKLADVAVRLQKVLSTAG
jgi:hypothetical protein